MKKIYTKPQIIFDSFELSQNIAAGCEFISNHALNVCALNIGSPHGTIFVEGVCDVTVPDGNDGICYHVPTDDKNVFSS